MYRLIRIFLFVLVSVQCFAQGLQSDDPSLFHFGRSNQMLHGNFKGIDYVESCLSGDNGSKIVSIKFKNYIYVAWIGVLNSVNVACIGSSHLKELTQGEEHISRNVYHGWQDTLGGFAYANYSPTMTIVEDTMFVFYNDHKDDNRIHYLKIAEEGTVKIAGRGDIHNSPTDVVNITALDFSKYVSGSVAFLGSSIVDHQVRWVLAQPPYDQKHSNIWDIAADIKLGEKCLGTVGVVEVDFRKYLLAWTGEDPGHQLNSAYFDPYDGVAKITEKHTYIDHSSHVDGPVLFRKENKDDRDIHILWRGAGDDIQIWQGVINLNNKDDFKQFAIPKEIGVANRTPTLISLNEMVTYMFWPTHYGSGIFDIDANLMMAKALDYPYQDWMGRLIKDEHTLKNLVLPGSNNAGMNDVAQITQYPGVYRALELPDFGACNECGFVTQSSDVKEQMEMGYRYFGINLTNVKYSAADIGKSPYWEDHNALHSSVQPVDHFTTVCLGEGFENMLSDARDFLKAHPKEVIIINIKDLNPGTFSLSSIYDLLQKTLPNFMDVIYQKKYEKSFADFINKPIGEFRGKIILTVADLKLASELNLIPDIFETSHDNQYRYVNTTNTQISKLVENQTNFLKNSAYTGSYKRLDWQLNLTLEKVLCDLSPFKECAEHPKPGLWHHLWYVYQCAGELAEMSWTVYKAFAEPEDPRSIATIVGWVASAFGRTSLYTMKKANHDLYPTVFDLQGNHTIRKDNMVNIIYTDASDYLYTDLCLQLITDFNEYDEVNPYNNYIVVSDRHTGVTCNQPKSGVASVTVQGGVAPYTYKWISTGDTSATAVGLSEGYHKVRISDAMGHTVTRRVYVSFNPQSHSGLASRSMTKTEGQPNGLANYYEADCENLIAKVATDYTTSALKDTLSLSVWIDQKPNPLYVKRHYQISPAGNNRAESGLVTLYFTQEEFNEFNKNSTYKLPTHSADSAGMKNLMIWQKIGERYTENTAPDYFTKNIREIFPKTANVVWNNGANRWEVTFHSDGFGAYFLTTHNGLEQNRWIAVTAYLTTGKPQVQWGVAELEASEYYVEYSYDQTHFAVASILHSKGRGTNTYQFYHENLQKLIDSSGNGIVYYRIRQIRTNEPSAVSESIAVNYAEGRALIIYPNPVTDELTIQSTTDLSGIIRDLTGKTIQTIELRRGQNIITTTHWPIGHYILSASNGEHYRILRGH